MFGKCPAHVWSELKEREQLAVFASTKSALPSRENQEGQGTKWMVVVDGQGVPLVRPPSLCFPDGSPARGDDAGYDRVGRRHHRGRTRQKPERVIADRACDCDPLRLRFAFVRATQDGPALRPVSKRWLLERTIG